MGKGILRAFGLVRSALMYRANVLARHRNRAFYSAFVRPGDLCFDIGAHMGDHVCAFRALGARVVAVEPQPDFVAALRALHGRDPMVRILDEAVGAAPGTAALHIHRRNPTLSTLSADWIAQVGQDPSFPAEGWDERVEVPVTTLDALIEAHGLPALCKIDVEGFEAQVLAGLSRPIPCIAFEYVAAAHPVAASCVDRLMRLGRYRFNIAAHGASRPAFDTWLGPDDLAGWLNRLDPGEGSGNILARLEPAPA